MAIPERILDEVRERTNIADIISESVQLKRSGRNLLGLCPFHSEKTPSFSVREQEGTFHCFGCGKKGNVFNFLMETRGLTFPEAVRFLAQRAGVSLPAQTQDSREDDAERERLKTLRLLLREAAQIYRNALLDEAVGREARQYLKKRKVDDEILHAFGVGCAPDGRQFLLPRLQRILEEGEARPWSAEKLPDLLRQVGLMQVKDGDGGARPFDTFRDRIVFPIARSDGSVVAFGGRALHDVPGRPKYINSAESPVYQKRKTLFGLAQGLDAARRARTAFLVEGYFDVIAMHQFGLRNAFATCGTAVTPDHAQVLKRFVDRVFVVFDGDAAGMKAAATTFEIFLNSGIEVKTVMLPEGEDPSSLAETMSAEEFSALAEENAVPAVDAYLRHLRGSHEEGPALMGKVAEQFARVLLRVQNPVEREMTLRRGAEVLGVSFESLRELILAGREGRRERIRSSAAEAEGQPRAQSAPQSRSVEHRPQASKSPRASTLAPNARNQRVATEAAQKSEPAVAPFVRQLLVAVLCEPTLVGVLREMKSVRSDTALINEMPRNVQNFLNEVQAEGVAGVGSGEEADVAKLRELLTRHGLPAEILIDECRRQLVVGGAEPRRVVEALPQAVERQKLSTEVRSIRHEESSVGPDDLSRLAQEKLLKRRMLDQLRSTRQG